METNTDMKKVFVWIPCIVHKRWSTNGFEIPHSVVWLQNVFLEEWTDKDGSVKLKAFVDKQHFLKKFKK